ncbi:HSP20 family protein [Cytobacillus eiseniae]|uniref:HSP20 family protein n=1 Tax=Cytobacillus eiseniae TaxID=762947 RepID=A0ABS4RJY7_9BACI|nr:Hsp20/alpha crystallin family protein [Cytobacillus eiseniae]MBP2243220.1 HSP20 family protein [Cytobacillus eiseniae]
MTGKSGKFSWSKLPEGAEDVLGQEFWNDFQQLFPKKGPLIDLYELPDEGIILVELPGLHSIQDIKIKQSGMNIIIIGTISELFSKRKGSIIINERYTGPFERKIPIPFSFTAKDVLAKYQNGLLEIKIKKVKSEEIIDICFE